MTKIVHLTTVHSPFDNRIFHRECKTLAAAGYEVVLVACHDGDERVDEVQIRSVRQADNRLARMVLGTWRVFWTGWAEKGAVYHFHDPELIPAGLLLRMLGKEVVYDAHEDHVTAIMEREYLPSLVRRLVSRLFEWGENFSSRFFKLILAERYYAERFPRGQIVLNYSRFPEVEEGVLENRPRSNGIRLIYTGNVKVYRGAFINARILRAIPEAELFLVGRCSAELATEIEAAAGDGGERLHMEGVGYLVPFERIIEHYLEEQWTAGLAVFPPSPHTVKKELTKIFEYMAYEIPVVCSNFPNLKRIVEGEGCGICVDPEDPEEIADAVRWLAEHPEEGREMGKRGREAARRQYNWEAEADKLRRFYRELC
jgi:glycosyltransferase involved in cell wall biosynthesis